MGCPFVGWGAALGAVAGGVVGADCPFVGGGGVPGAVAGGGGVLGAVAGGAALGSRWVAVLGTLWEVATGRRWVAPIAGAWPFAAPVGGNAGRAVRPGRAGAGMLMLSLFSVFSAPRA